MTRADRIYPLDKSIQRELQKAERDCFNKDIIARFYKVRSPDITKASMLIYLIRLNQMSALLKKRFDEATVEDIECLIFAISKCNLAESTKNRMRKILKVFYRWLKKCPRGQFPPEVAWVVTKKSAVITVKAEDLLPFEECVKITEHATNLRDKALFQCQLDAGCRIGEILPVKVGEVEFNDYGAVLNSDGKTGEAPLILTWSAGVLTQWMNIHPFRNDKDAPLFPKLHISKPQQLPYHGARSALKKCIRRAGYSHRRIWFHLFKHVSCTWDSYRGMPQPYRNFKHHWSPNSDMNRVYEHLSNSVIPKIQQWNPTSQAEQRNISKEDEIVKLTTNCKRCKYENPRDSTFCNRCGFTLDEKKAVELIMKKSRVDILLTKLEDPEKLDKLLALVQE